LATDHKILKGCKSGLHQRKVEDERCNSILDKFQLCHFFLYYFLQEEKLPLGWHLRPFFRVCLHLVL